MREERYRRRGRVDTGKEGVEIQSVRKGIYRQGREWKYRREGRGDTGRGNIKVDNSKDVMQG